jgi:Uma2 family endonuclease
VAPDLAVEILSPEDHPASSSRRSVSTSTRECRLSG